MFAPDFRASAGATLPEAIEVALLSRDEGSAVVAPLRGLPDSDALLNLQADGTVWLSPAATLVSSARVSSGVPLDLSAPLSVLVKLPSTLPAGPVTLYVDLIGSGSLGSSLTVSEVRTRNQDAVVLRLGRGWNAFTLPLEVTDPRVTSVLADVSFARAVWTFDSTGNRYVPVSELRPGHGYFVLALEAAGVSVFGVRASPDWSHLLPGWNLVGSPDGSRPPGADSDLGRALWSLDPHTLTRQRAPPDEPLDPDRAHWFWVAP